MVKYETECVSCGLPCLGSGCPYYRVPVYYCDNCGCEDAECTINDHDMCEDCARDYLKQEFADLDVCKMAKLLNINMEYRC